MGGVSRLRGEEVSRGEAQEWRASARAGLEALGWTAPGSGEAEDGSVTSFDARVRIDTPKEWDYYNSGGILHYVLRQLASAATAVA